VPLLRVDAFAAYIAKETLNAFQWAGQPPKIAPVRGMILTPSKTWFLGLI